MFVPFGRDADRDHLGAQFPKHLRGRVIGRTIGAIDHNLQPIKRQVCRERSISPARHSGTDRRRSVSRARYSRPRRVRFRPPEWPRSRPRPRPTSLKPSGPKNLIPLSSCGLWLAEIITPTSARIERTSSPTAGVGTGPKQQHVHAGRGEPRRQRVLEHIARQPRILADHHAVRGRAVAAEIPPRRRAQSAAPFPPSSDGCLPGLERHRCQIVCVSCICLVLYASGSSLSRAKRRQHSQ